MIEAAQCYACPKCGGDLREPQHVCAFDDTLANEDLSDDVPF